MKNKEMNENAPVELDEKMLNAVSGGTEYSLTVMYPYEQIKEEAEKRD